MINFNSNVASLAQNYHANAAKLNPQEQTDGFKKTVDAVKHQISKIDDQQKDADQSVIDLLTGKNEDITSVVAAVSKADMSFKLLIGVRNKLIDAYKQTMQMNI
ncbi:MAG: flagellar hook-basal body complex protein FliE [Sedimentisphaerales bacterium]|nr:flagellar hook-basal body complex protein FliE [Sedimentisphaerales bacterium]